jgi:lipopolysaccharide transport system permease protein
MINYLNPVQNMLLFGEIMSTIKKHWNLIVEMTRREVFGQYRGQILGSAWAVIHPLCMMGLYVFIFAFVFQARVGGTREMPLDYTTYILSGLIPWLCFQQAMLKACVGLVGQSNLVKQVVFPIEVLPVKSVLSSLPTIIISLLVLIIYSLFKYNTLSSYYCFLPFLMFIQILAMLGVAFIFSAVSVFIRDLKDIVAVLITLGIYLMPIVYLPNWLPNIFKPVLYVNFFSYMVWCYQDILYFGRIEHPYSWIVFLMGSLLLFTIGYRLFIKLKPYYGNYL